MDILKAITECLTGCSSELRSSDRPTVAIYTDKQPLGGPHTAEDAATEFVHALCTAEKNSADLRDKLNSIVYSCGGILEAIAKAIFNALVEVLKLAAKVAQALAKAIEKVKSAIAGFSLEHPVWFMLLAIGVLVIFSPWVIKLLGFGELGPIEGTFASWWQRLYANQVPKGSLFAFFQKLGMKW